MVNFVKPDRFVEELRKGFLALGVSADPVKAGEEFLSISNLPHQRELVERLYGRLIPKGLPVTVSSIADQRKLFAKYALPDTGGTIAAAIAPGIDSRHELVLVLTEEYLTKGSCVLAHELVHWRQFEDGYLTHGPEGMSWIKGEEEFTLDPQEDLIEKHRLARFGGDDLLWYEMNKPWELEAYATTTPRHIRLEWSKRCCDKAERYLLAN